MDPPDAAHVMPLPGANVSFTFGLLNETIFILQNKLILNTAWYPVISLSGRILQFTPWWTCWFQNQLNFSAKYLISRATVIARCCYAMNSDKLLVD